MMTDPLTWSPLNLGRWSGTQVRVHVFFIVFVVFRLLGAALTPGHPIVETTAWLLLLFLTLAVHEGAHALAAARVGCDPDEVRLWPLGNMMSPLAATRSTDHPLVILAGPAVNLAVVVLTAVGLGVFGHARFVWNPFEGSGAPLLGTGKTAATFTVLWWAGWFGYLNWVLLLANLLPALPFDLGRFVRALLGNVALTSTKDNLIGPWTAHSIAALLFLVGLVRLLFYRSADGLWVIGLALLVEVMVRSEARMMEEGYYEDGVFGYDFSEGYTSLEANTAAVRPFRESALKRWRRRRSDLRRRRRRARAAAEDQRMDEILAKLSREGRSALTAEENRFLVRISSKYRNKPKAQ